MPARRLRFRSSCPRPSRRIRPRASVRTPLPRFAPRSASPADARCASSAPSTRAESCRRRASWRAATCAACSRCPASRAAARCWCTIIRPACSSRRGPTWRSPRGCTTTASASGSSTTRRPSSTSSSRCRRAPSSRALDPSRDRSRSRARRRRRGGARALRGPAEPARDGREIARLYNDGGVGLLEAGTGVGKSLGYLVPALRWAARERRAHGRVDEHDQPAGAARRQGSAVPREGARRPAGALRAAQGMAQLSLPRAARAGARLGQRAVRGRRAGRARRDSRLGGAHARRLAERPADGAARRGLGRGRRRARPLPARAVSARTASASSSRRAARRRRRT